MEPGMSVAIVGPGTLGLLAVHFFRAFGAGRIILIGTRDEQLAFGKTLGATDSINIRTGDVLERVEQLTGGQGVEMDSPVFCRYRNPVEALGRAVVKDAMIDIVMRGALSTGVKVRPWDYIFADMDGVIVIPREIVKEVLEESEKDFTMENEARELYSQPGISALDVYKRLGKL
jgi:NADPH:quinone reductase-like Zn-dependent oxidoreductase